MISTYSQAVVLYETHVNVSSKGQKGAKREKIRNRCTVGLAGQCPSAVHVSMNFKVVQEPDAAKGHTVQAWKGTPVEHSISLSLEDRVQNDNFEKYVCKQKNSK